MRAKSSSKLDVETDENEISSVMRTLWVQYGDCFRFFFDMFYFLVAHDRVQIIATQHSTAALFRFLETQKYRLANFVESLLLLTGTDPESGIDCSRRSPVFCLEMIWAEFLAGATPGERNSSVFSIAICRYVELLRGPERNELIQSLKESA